MMSGGFVLPLRIQSLVLMVCLFGELRRRIERQYKRR